jgi:hypothetical protein
MSERQQPEGERADEAGVVENVALLDLSAMRSPEELARIRSIRNVATVVVPESLTGALAAIPTRNVAHVVPVPDGAQVNAHVGAVTVDGAGLEASGERPTVLMVTGALVITGPVARIGLDSITVVGAVVAPAGSEAVLTPVLRRTVGRLVYYPYSEGQDVKVFQGDTRLRGEALANPGGSPEDIAIVAGTLLITSPVREIGFRRLVVVGSLVAPEESELTLGPALTMVGGAIWYTAPPRLFTGEDRFGPGFFELLDGPTTLVLNGSFEIEAGVPVQLLRDRVAMIALNGVLRAPRALVPILQVLAVHKEGVIQSLDG